VDDQVKEDEMGGACGMNGGRREMHTHFWWKILKEKGHLGGLGIDGTR
jgi:hypothetical protein